MRKLFAILLAMTALTSLADAKSEVKDVNERYASLERTLLKRLDCDLATKELKGMLDTELKTPQGQSRCEACMLGIAWMKSVQMHFMKVAKGYKFKDQRYIYSMTSKDITIATPQPGVGVKPKLKKTPWDSFYNDSPAKLNEMIVYFIEGGRKEFKLGLKEWSELMMGSAVYLRARYGDSANAKARSDKLVAQAVKEFPACKRRAAEVFPDMSL